jgi:subtilisin family serine protease
MPDIMRYYVVLRAPPARVQRLYEKATAEDIGAYIAEHAFQDEKPKRLPFDVVALPSNDTSFLGEEHPREQFVVSLAIRERDALGTLARGIARNKEAFFGGGADVPFAGTEHWCPRDAPAFSDRAAAERLLEVPYVRDEKKLTGKRVNVVIVDQGLDRAALGSNYGGGWSVGKIRPGTTKRQPGTDSRTHGMMIAQNVLAVAPDATIFDLPLVPWKISDIPAFLSLANAAYGTMRAAIANFKTNPRFSGPWVIVNPWGIYDSRLDLRPPHDYINNPNHPFNRLVEAVVGDGHDVVFAAGNCGQFCPDERCGAQDNGPGRSILGANSLGAVLTFGAVRTDTVWLGYSSQGPGQSRLAHDKPDLCAPSQFCETGDAYTTNSGTSAACAVAAGVIVGLRSKQTAAAVTPPQLKNILIRTARKVDGPGWNGRRGNGILNAKAAYYAIP